MSEFFYLTIDVNASQKSMLHLFLNGNKNNRRNETSHKGGEIDEN